MITFYAIQVGVDSNGVRQFLGKDGVSISSTNVKLWSRPGEVEKVVARLERAINRRAYHSESILAAAHVAKRKCGENVKVRIVSASIHIGDPVKLEDV